MDQIHIGDRVRCTDTLKLNHGYFEPGTAFTVLGISRRGYHLEDDEGNTIDKVERSKVVKILPPPQDE